MSPAPDEPENSDIEIKCEHLFRAFTAAWVREDLDAVIDMMSDDIRHNINVDGDLVPYARSVIGKDAMREKLELMLETFEIGAFVTSYVTVRANILRARMRLLYIHRATSERLNVPFRVVVECQDGLIARVDEFYDPFYVEAFERLVSSRQRDP